MLKLKFTIALLLFLTFAKAQFSHPDFDSLLLQRSAEEKNTYTVDHSVLKSLSVTVKDATASYSGTGSILGDVANEFMSSLLKNFSASTSVNFSYPAMIKSVPEGYGWNVGLFVGGPAEKNANTTGMPSSGMYWQNGAVGHLIDDKGQISSYGYSLNGFNNSKLRAVYDDVKLKHESSAGEPPIPEFTRQTQIIFGDFKGANMVHVIDAKTKLTHIYINGRLDAVFTDDRSALDGRIFLTKRSKNPFLLWLRKGLSEDQKADMIRMAVFSKFVVYPH